MGNFHKIIRLHGRWGPRVVILSLIAIMFSNHFVFPTARAQAAEATLTWDANDQPALAGYRLYVGRESRAYEFYIDTGRENIRTVTNLEDGETYYMAVTAYDAQGNESDFSNEIEVTMPTWKLPALPVLALNCGGPGFIGHNGIAYQSDTYFTDGRTYQTSAPIQGTDNGFIYQSERFGNFSYNIPLPNGHYWVTLNFAEIYYYSARGYRIFDVYLQDNKALINLDLFAIVGKNSAYDVTLPTSVTQGILNIRFQTIAGNAKVNGIVIQGK